MSPEISILLPVYNGEKTLKKTLESLLDQSYTNFELLVCIDGTNDGSEQIIKNFQDERIKIFHNPKNLGLGRTLNRLISCTSKESKYLAMAEQDDWYYPYRLEKQISFLKANPEVGMVSGIAEFFNGTNIGFKMPGLLVHGKQFPQDPIEMFKLNYRYGPKINQTCIMIRKSVHIHNGFYFSQHFHILPIDWLYMLRFSLVSPIAGLHVPLVLMDRSSQRGSVTTNKKAVYRGNRELIRSIYWEYNKILSKKDFKFAMNTEIFYEGKNHGIVNYFTRLVEALTNDTNDPRYNDYFNHFKRRINLVMSGKKRVVKVKNRVIIPT